MDNEQVLSILKAYAEGNNNQAELEAARQYLRSISQNASGLERLYTHLTQPGGISCETAQELMLDYIDPVSQAEMKPAQRDQLVQHLAQCPECSEEYLALSSIYQVQPEEPLTMPRFVIPSVQKAWPLHWIINIQKEIDTTQTLLLTLKLKPEQVTNLGQTRGSVTGLNPPPTDFDQLTLFQGMLGKLGVGLKAQAQRTGASTCRLKVTVEGEELMGKMADQLIICSFDNTGLNAKTDQKGQVIFDPIPITALDKIQLKVKVQI